jgi:SAM-dependent methyltransferase
MSAEFDTVAEWTAEIATELGTAFRIPAGCRGSGTPAALDWLIEGLGLARGSSLLDCGAGVGGPAAYAAQQRSVQPVLIEPEAGACRAASALFGHPVVQASASALPVGDESFDAAWALGVLCTMSDQLPLLTELRRAVRPAGRIGLLVFVAHASGDFEKPTGNHFPTKDGLLALVDGADLQVEAWRSAEEMAPASPDWKDREETVARVLAERHGHDRAWQLAEQQAGSMGRLLADSVVTGELLTLRRRDR